jgi:hypothetical protein
VIRAGKLELRKLFRAKELGEFGRRAARREASKLRKDQTGSLHFAGNNRHGRRRNLFLRKIACMPGTNSG